jgi:hypothetical protein
VFLVYAPRRVECTRCGVRVEEMPWAGDIVKSCGSVEHGSGGFLPILFVCTAFCLDTIDELHTSTHQR